MNKSLTTAITLVFLLFCCATNAQQYTRKTNLPHVIINTLDGRSITSKDVYVYSNIYYVDEKDNVLAFDSTRIRGRGNSTWNMSKKPYKIKFAEKQKLLGKGYANAKTWTLLANAGDKTLMRNAVTSLMGDFLGLKNNPAHKFVDVTLNGSYLGTYHISDQIEVRPHRVDVAEQDDPLTEDSNISGGYLLEVDGFHDGNCFSTASQGVYIRVHYPEEETISYEQNKYIRNYINTFERALFSSDFTDETNGYRQYVDSASLVNWFLVTEISANIDGYYSTYFYKDKDDPYLYFGPIWDYDIAYNNDSRIPNTQTKLMDESGYGDAKKWVHRMWEDPWFGNLVNKRFEEVVGAGLEDYLYTQIDSIAELINESQTLNYNRWGISTRMYHEIVLYSSYQQYVSDLKSFIRSHLSYLSGAFKNKKAKVPTPVFSAGDYWYRIANAKVGNCLDVNGGSVCTWAQQDSRESQLWKVVPVDDYFVLINKVSGLALTDGTVGYSTETTNTGTNLSVAELNLGDESQHWQLVPQGYEGYYNLVNRKSLHTANVSGGSTSNGASIVSYTTDSKNSTSVNRLWSISGVEKIEVDEPETAIAMVEPEEYALAYNPQSRVLHFGSETPESLTFVVNVHSVNGSLVRSFVASEVCSVADLPSGVYVISWKVSGKIRNVKVRL